MGYHLDKILGVIALALSLLALTGILFTDTYSHGAQVEASGNDALGQLFTHNNDTRSRFDRSYDHYATQAASASAQQKEMQ